MVLEEEDYWYADGSKLFEKFRETIQKERIGKWGDYDEGKIQVTFTFTKSELRDLNQYFEEEEKRDTQREEKEKKYEKFFSDLAKLLPTSSRYDDNLS